MLEYKKGEWLTAPRSGEYKQGFAQRQGVLADIMYKHGELIRIEDEKGMYSYGEPSRPQVVYLLRADNTAIKGTPSMETQRLLSRMKDNPSTKLQIERNVT